MVPACSDKVSRVSSYSGYCLALSAFAYVAFTRYGRPFHAVLLADSIDYTVRTPGSKLPGLGSSAFARRYLRNHFCFLFLRLLRCFSSPGSLRLPMDSANGDRGLLCRVAPFRYLRLNVYLQLTAAFRSLSRLSSALSAKASALRPI